MIRANGTRWEGLDGLAEELLAELHGVARNAVHDAADMFANELKSTLTGARTGRAYKVTKRIEGDGRGGKKAGRKRKGGRLHIASAPGEAPAVLYGALRNSVGREDVRVVDGTSYEAYVGVGLGVQKDAEVAENYAARLEFGGVDKRGIRILPRPYMEPTRIRVEPRIEALFADALGSRG